MNMTYEVDFKRPEERNWHQYGVNSIEEAGVRYPLEVQEFVKKELAEMEAEMKRRYPDAV